MPSRLGFNDCAQLTKRVGDGGSVFHLDVNYNEHFIIFHKCRILWGFFPGRNLLQPMKYLSRRTGKDGSCDAARLRRAPGWGRKVVKSSFVIGARRSQKETGRRQTNYVSQNALCFCADSVRLKPPDPARG